VQVQPEIQRLLEKGGEEAFDNSVEGSIKVWPNGQAEDEDAALQKLSFSRQEDLARELPNRG
jgi:hypothetical protein